MKRFWIACLLALYGGLVFADAPVRSEPTRGELLYTTYCIVCHTEQVHWRDKRLAKNWRGLVFEVKRWQDVVKLEWSADEIDDVASYLNTLHYHYRRPAR